ncbi:MAG: hypothetical protein KJN85_02250 [Maribacter sp.]|nr:hypothetical protein [Maribacter sp.]MBT8314544.1 hypothetical protein [Maribacter sp.]
MQKDNQAKFDDYIQERIKQEGLDQPSMNFTNAVISKIEAQKQNKVLEYKPLLGKKTWYAMAVLVIGIFVFLIYGNATMEFNWLPSNLTEQWGQINLLSKLPSLSVSNIYVYAFIGLAFFVMVQVYLLKNHFSKHYYID